MDPEPTTSLCPTCLEPAPGRYVEQEGRVRLERTCPEHGGSSEPVWANAEHWAWAKGYGPPELPEGDLQVANQHACLAVVEVTQGCNLCSFCFASSGPGGEHLPREEVIELLEVVRSDGGPRPIQFSGGEPTIRDDLPELVAQARGMGFEHIEVNTNGIRLAQEEGYAQELSEAGVSAIYLQFDGFEAATHQAIRDADLTGVKERAIQACQAAGLPVILVCTVVKGTNEHELGDIVRYALEHREAIRSINFQPVFHAGRFAGEEELFSLDAVACTLAEQLPFLEAKDLLPVPCCSAYCQAATALLPDGEGGAVPLTRFLSQELWEELAGLVTEADWMEVLAGTPKARDRSAFLASCCGLEVPGGAEELVEEILPVAITGFMDASSADVDRLETCCIAVPTKQDGLVPFCAYNMTTRDGRYALRERYGWGGRSQVE